MTEIVSPPEPLSEEPASPPEPSPSRVPEAPPAPDWVEAEADARTLVDTLAETTEVQWKQWVATVTTERLEPLRVALEEAAAAHDRLLEKAALDEEGVPASALWQRATDYRWKANKAVAASLRTHLAKQNIGEALGDGCLNVLAPLGSYVEEAPSHCSFPRPIALFAPDDEDGPVPRVRKRIVRMRRGLERGNLRLINGLRRLFRLAPILLPAQSRLVPVRLLCAYHAQVRLPDAIVSFHEAIQQHHAMLVGRIETALTDWTHALLDAERGLDRSAFHQPSILQTIYAIDEDVPEEPVVAEVVEALWGAAQGLQEALVAAAEAVALPEMQAEDQFRTATDELTEDLRYAGTFLLKLKTRRPPPPDSQPEARIGAQRRPWAAWHQEAVDRLDLNERLIALRRELLRLEDRLLQRIAHAALRPILQTFQPLIDQLRKAEEQAAQASDAARTSGNVEGLADTLRALQTQTLETLQAALSDLPGLVSADQALTEPGSPEWEALQRWLKKLPEQVSLHPLPPTGKTPVPDKRPWQLDVRQGAQDRFGPFSERLAEPCKPLRKEILRVWGETEQVSYIVQYNLDVALDVLTPPETEDEPGEADDQATSKDPVQDARELATDGLRRAADTLTDLARSLETPWQAFAGAVFTLFEKDWADVHRATRTVAFVEEQWFDFLLRARRETQRLRRRVKALWQQYSHVAYRWFRLGRRRTQQLIERGRSAIGTFEATEEDRLKTLDAISLANIRAMQGDLPLVYRKLFSLRPVTEPSLLEGRKADLQRISRHVQRWKNGQTAGMLMVTVPLGSGRTSLLNVVCATLKPEAEACLLTFDARLSDTSDFAAAVAEVLGIEMIGEPSLDALEAQLLNAPRPDPTCICLIDNLEHLFLRALGGSDLFERVLVFFSRTDTKICWIATIGDRAWRFLEQTLGSATGLVTAYQPALLNGDTLKDIILNRHQRSGMVLRFAVPKDLSPLVRRRLNRARTPEDQQAILRGIYFERLFRQCGQNVMLALFYWLRSADFESEEGLLTVQPIQPLSFRFFESFDLARAFTLKAFLLHNTLSLEEHNHIFRMNDAGSIYLLESLLNLHLIEPCNVEARRDTTSAPNRILPDERYRLHPLILHPTYLLLRERNIIH